MHQEKSPLPLAEVRSVDATNVESRETAPAPPAKVWRVGTLAYTAGGLVALYSWLLLGDFAIWLKDRSVLPITQLLLKHFGASDFATSLLIGSLPALIVMLVVPVISWKSDRHRGRWGRRIPFLLIPTPIAVLSMVAMAFCPQLGGLLHNLLGAKSPGPEMATLIVIGASWTLFEFASITALAIFGSLVKDVVPENLLGRFFGLFRAVSLLAGIVFNFWMMGKAESHFSLFFLGIGLLFGVAFTVMCLKVKEGRYDPPPASSHTTGFAALQESTASYFKECFSNSYYRWYFLALALSTVTQAPVNLFSVFFAKSIGMSMDDYGKCIALVYCISLALSYFLGWAADRFHPLRMCILTLGLYAIAMLLGGMFATNVKMFSLAFVAHSVFNGAWMTVSASLGPRMLPGSRFAQFASAGGMVVALFTIILAPVMGIFLDSIGHVYRYTFHAGFGLTVLALAANFVLYRKFLQLGGPRHYVAPE